MLHSAWYTAHLPVRGCCWWLLWAFSEVEEVKECSTSVISAIPHQDSNCFVDKTLLLFTPTSQITFDTQHAGPIGPRATSLPCDLDREMSPASCSIVKGTNADFREVKWKSINNKDLMPHE